MLIGEGGIIKTAQEAKNYVGKCNNKRTRKFKYFAK